MQNTPFRTDCRREKNLLSPHSSSSSSCCQWLWSVGSRRLLGSFSPTPPQTLVHLCRIMDHGWDGWVPLLLMQEVQTRLQELFTVCWHVVQKSAKLLPPKVPIFDQHQISDLLFCTSSFLLSRLDFCCPSSWALQLKFKIFILSLVVYKIKSCSSMSKQIIIDKDFFLMLAKQNKIRWIFF